MILSIEKVSDISVLHLQGDLGPLEIEHVTTTLKSFIEKSWNQIVLDFQDVHHIDYKTILSLTTASLQVKAHEGDLKLANLSQYLKRIFNLTGDYDCCETYDSLAEAILSFENRSYTLSCPC